MDGTHVEAGPGPTFCSSYCASTSALAWGRYGLAPKIRLPRIIMSASRYGTTVMFQIDEELKAICEGRAPRPETNGWSYRAWVQNLRETIIKRRQENHDARTMKNWQPDQVSKVEQHELLNWIERELNK